MVGLGRMGGNMAQRLVRGGHRVVGFDMSPDAVQAAGSQGAAPAASLQELVQGLKKPRAVWVMLPQGEPTEATMQALLPLLDRGDVVLDGGNANYKDTLRRVPMFEAAGVEFMDVGTSGGIWGLEGGYSLMVGGKREVFQRLEPIFQTLAPGPDRGYGYMGVNGSGHFTKMVHNGVEYALMQAYAEGFEVLAAKKEFALDLPTIGEVWSHGSVVRSWLLEMVVLALKEDQTLRDIKGYVEDTGEGRWTVKEMVDLAVPAPVITLSLYERFRSRQPDSLSHRLLAKLRKIFGGHAVQTQGK